MKKWQKLIPVALFLLALIFVGGSLFAWYVGGAKKADVEDVEIDAPPLIYIRDDSLEEMKTFNLDGLERGTNYSFVFCVTPAKKETAVNFSLAVAYTGNLGMDINLYPVETVVGSEPQTTHVKREINNASYYFKYSNASQTWGNVVVKKADGINDKEENQNPNDGTRKTYSNLEFGTEAPESTSTYLDTLNDTREYRFFVMDITWLPMPDDGTNYEKEVDIIYIIARGRPISITS